MDNQLMLVWNGIVISWFAFFVTIACVVGTVTACILRCIQKKSVSDIFVLTTFSVPLGLLLSRINYCMFSYESIDSLSDFFSITNGGFGLYGAFLGVFGAALIAYLLFGTEDLGGLLDCAATGGALAVTIGRFATRFTTAEIGYPVKFRLFTVYDSSQNVRNLAIYQLDGICEALVFLTCLIYFLYARKKEKAAGKTALLVLALHGANQVVMDSMRADPLKLGVNNFIKISQIIGILCCLSILVYFMVVSAKKTRFSKFHIFAIPIILLSILLGVVGEYRVGDSDYITKHLVMAFGMLVLSWLTVDFAVRSVSAKSSPAKELSSSVRNGQTEQLEEKQEAPHPLDFSGSQNNSGHTPQERLSEKETPEPAGNVTPFSPEITDSERRNNTSRIVDPSLVHDSQNLSPAAPEPVHTERRRSFNRHRKSSEPTAASFPPAPPEESKLEKSTPEESKPEEYKVSETYNGHNPEPIVSPDSGSYNPDFNTDFNLGSFHF